MKLFGFFERRDAAKKAARMQRVQECDNIMDLADMYGAARAFGDRDEMEQINDRMAVVMREQGLTSKGAKP